MCLYIRSIGISLWILWSRSNPNICFELYPDPQSSPCFPVDPGHVNQQRTWGMKASITCASCAGRGLWKSCKLWAEHGQTGQTHHTPSYTSQVIQWRSDAERKNINWTSVEHWWFGKSSYNYVSIYIPSISNSCRVFKYQCDHPSVSTVKPPQRRSQHSWHVCWGLGAAQPWREARSRHSMSQLGAQHVEVQDQDGLQSMLQEALHGVHVILQTSPVLVWRDQHWSTSGDFRILCGFIICIQTGRYFIQTGRYILSDMISIEFHRSLLFCSHFTNLKTSRLRWTRQLLQADVTSDCHSDCSQLGPLQRPRFNTRYRRYRVTISGLHNNIPE